MIVSITGGSGFIGKYLVKKHLQQGDKVRVLSRKMVGPQNGVDYFLGDLSKKVVDLKSFVSGADILYNCVGEINDESLMRQLHVYGTQQLEEVSKGEIGRWVQLSSVGAYGVCRNGIVNEESPKIPCGVYEQTKTEADKVVKNSGIPYVILRPSNVFGITMPNQSLFQMLKMLRKGIFFYLGKEGALVNYVHVEDVVEALLQCGSNTQALGNTYNLSQTTEIEQMAKYFLLGLDIEKIPFRLPEWPIGHIAKNLGRINGFPLTVSRVDALTGRCCYKSDKIINELDFDFSSTLEEQFQLFASLS